jgi:hypothetical protein
MPVVRVVRRAWMGAMIDGRLLHSDVHESDIHKSTSGPCHSADHDKTAEIGRPEAVSSRHEIALTDHGHDDALFFQVPERVFAGLV